MPRFSSPKKQGAKQAASVMQQMQGKQIRSVGTVRNYEQALRNVATSFARKNINLKDLTIGQANKYLQQRAVEIGQSGLDMERQAMQAMMQHVTSQLASEENIPVVKSNIERTLANEGRA